jgi:hypothetical protein
MNGPDAGSDGIRFHHQNTHGESNPEHFSVTATWAWPSVPDRCALSNITQLPFYAPPVLFRYSLTAKLMQKIHSLTDN